MADKPSLADKLTAVLNGYENESNTPDFILAQFLEEVLLAWNAAVRSRAAWYGRMDVPAERSVPFPDETPQTGT